MEDRPLVKPLELAKISYVDARKYFGEMDVVLLPIGSTEQHGPHNPLGTDHIIAYELAKEASRRTGVMVLPVIPYGMSEHHMHFPGTVSVSPDALKLYVKEVCLSLKRHGVRKIVIVNGHGGNLNPLLDLARELRRDHGMLIFIFQWWTAISDKLTNIYTAKERGHAAAEETSMIMYIDEDLVNRERMVDEEVRDPLSGARAYFPGYTDDYTKSGVFGVAKTASREKGELSFEESVRELVKLIDKVREVKIIE